MTDRKSLSDPNETPEDVATLYSWANLHGAKYRDFSASRAQTREKARQRVLEAIEEERRHAQGQAEAEEAAEVQRVAEAARAANEEHQAELAAQAAAYQAQSNANQAAQPYHRAQAEHFDPPAPVHLPTYPGFGPAPVSRPVAAQPQYGPAREESYSQSGNPWAATEPSETPGHPAGYAPDRSDSAGQSAIQIPQPPPSRPMAPEDTLQRSRQRLTSRWFALNSVFEGAPPIVTAASALAPIVSHAPVLGVFSLAGGVGKTSLVATLGRALSARGERVLLVDTAAYGLLPLFFGARDRRPGTLRTFSPPGASNDASLQLVTLDPETLGPETASQETLISEIGRCSRNGVSRVIVDLATASGATTRRIMRMAPQVLVPVVPDMNSVVSVSSIDDFFQQSGAAVGSHVLPYYLLNRFDASLPLHLDVREVLRERLGDRLLPFEIRRAPAVSEALAEGMTVIDYAPNSSVTEDFASLAGWVKSLSAPAAEGYRGVRWSER